MVITKKNVLIVYFLDLKNSPRSYKQICALKDFCHITELSFGASGHADEFYKIIVEKDLSFTQKIYCNGLMALGFPKPQLARYQIEREQEFLQKKFDLIIVHDISPCPLAFSLFPNTPIILDLHEYLPKNFGNLYWRIRFSRSIYNLCKEYLPQATATITVSEHIAQTYEDEFGVRPTVTYNAPLAENLQQSAVDPHKIHLVNHGVCAKQRQIEKMYELMEILDERFMLHFYFVGSGEYFEKMKQRAKQSKNIVWHEPVPMVDISKELNKYDIGLFMLPINSFNHDNTIANKFFEFIQARVFPAVWPTKGMKYIIDKYNVGFYTQDFSVKSMATMLNALSVDDIIKHKERCHLIAQEITGEKSIEKIRNIVLKILN